MKPTKCPAREKKWGKKSEKRGKDRKRKVKVKTAESLLNPKKFCFLPTPEHLDQKAVKCTTCKQVCGKF